MFSKDVEITAPNGLHTRPAAQFVKEAKEAGLNVSMYEQDGGHEWDYWDKCIEQTIKCIAGEDSKWQ